MAADQAPTRDQTVESVLARYARAVTQPGGMNIDWPRVGQGSVRLARLSPD